MCSHTVRIMFNNPKLGVVVILVGCFQHVVAGGGVGGCCAGCKAAASKIIYIMALGQKPQGKLIEAAPNVYLVSIVIPRYILICSKCGYIGERVCGAATGSSIQPIIATIGFHTVEPDQPGAHHILDLSDLTGCERRRRGVGVGADTIAIRRGEDGSFRTAVDGDIEVFAHGGAIGGRIGERDRKIFGCLHIKARGRSRRILVTGIQNLGAFRFTGRNQIIGGGCVAQKFYGVRQSDRCGSAVGGVLDLNGNGYNSVICAILLCYRHYSIVFIERVCVQTAFAAGIQQVMLPGRNTDFGVTGGNRQPIFANVAAGRCIRQISVEYSGDFLKIGFITTAARGDRVLHGQLHGNEQRGQRTVSGLDGVDLALLIGKSHIEIFRGIDGSRRRIRGFRGGLQRCGQFGIRLIGLPSLACQAPGVDCGQDTFPVQRGNGVHKCLGSFAQGCFRGGRSEVAAIGAFFCTVITSRIFGSGHRHRSLHRRYFPSRNCGVNR